MTEINIKKLLSELKFKAKYPKCNRELEAKFGETKCPNCQTMLQFEPKNDWGNLRENSRSYTI